jgi:hypothetical protein
MKILKFFEKKTKLSGISLIFLEILLDGLVLNFMVFAVFGLRFTWYTWLGWGFIPYILGEMFPRIIIKFKKRMI